MVGPNGLEPSTSSVSRKRSNQLSYGPTDWLTKAILSLVPIRVRLRPAAENRRPESTVSRVSPGDSTRAIRLGRLLFSKKERMACCAEHRWLRANKSLKKYTQRLLKKAVFQFGTIREPSFPLKRN
jgi:hypothetical protein